MIDKKLIIQSTLAGIFSIITIGVLTVLSYKTSYGIFLIASFGSTMVLLYGYPESPFAQPKNVFFGHVLTAIVGLIFLQFVPLPIFITIPLAVGFGVLLGLMAAMRLNTWKDTVITIFALITYATPLFWVGLMMIILFSLNLGWFPTSGMENVAAFYEGWDRFKDIAHHLVLPTITLSLFYLALYTRMMRASMLEQYGAGRYSRHFRNRDPKRPEEPLKGFLLYHNPA